MSRFLSARKFLYKNSSGAGLVLVIAVCAIVSLLIGIMFSRYLIERRSLKSTIRNAQDGYTAEAGIKKVFYYLKADPKKGRDWRTGNLWADTLLKDRVFSSLTDEVSLSVVDDAGYLRIRSTCRNRSVEVRVAGLLPESLKKTLTLVSAKPLILKVGSQIKGDIRLNPSPQFQGGSLEGSVETNPNLALPIADFKPFYDAIKYQRYLLATPQIFERELTSPQHFSPDNPVPAKKVFVNDAVLMENERADSIWPAGTGLIIASTAELQVSGNTLLTDAVLLAIGPLKILDHAQLHECRLYSESAIEIGDQALVSGLLIAPEIRICGHASIIDPSIVFTGLSFKTGIISVQDQAFVQACVINAGNGKNFKIETGPAAQINGLVYSFAPITHYGEFSGYMYCRTFYEPVTGSDTANTNILSGRIIAPNPDDEYLIPIIFSEIKDFIPIKWQEN